MNKLVIAIALAAVLALSGCLQSNPQNNSTPQPGNSGGTATAETAEIQIINNAFSPSELTISVGTTVKWTNADGVPHTVTSAGNFDSGTIQPGKSFSFTFSKAGSFDYSCSIHPQMKGKVIVALRI